MEKASKLHELWLRYAQHENVVYKFGSQIEEKERNAEDEKQIAEVDIKIGVQIQKKVAMQAGNCRSTCADPKKRKQKLWQKNFGWKKVPTVKELKFFLQIPKKLLHGERDRHRNDKNCWSKNAENKK